MKQIDFNKLDTTVKLSLLVSMYIRNEMEDFHHKHLSDEQIQELNPIIRQAVYNTLRCYDVMIHGTNETERKLAEQLIKFQMSSIPDYWELPMESSFRKMLLEASGATP